MQKTVQGRGGRLFSAKKEMTHLPKRVWGPCTWTFLHAAAAKGESPLATTVLLRAVSVALPCPECKQHMQDYLLKHPPEGAVRDAQTASRYCFDLHNYVNSSTGKRELHPRILKERFGVTLPALLRVRTPAACRMPPLDMGYVVLG